MIRGVTGPSLGGYTIDIDGDPLTLTAKDDIETHNVPLYFMSLLDDRSIHQLTLSTVGSAESSSEEGTSEVEVGLVLDRVDLWGPAGQTGFM